MSLQRGGSVGNRTMSAQLMSWSVPEVVSKSVHAAPVSSRTTPERIHVGRAGQNGRPDPRNWMHDSDLGEG